MLSTKFKGLVALAVMLVSSVGLSSGIAYASDTPDYRMQISPIKDAIEELKPGEEYRGRFDVRNTGTKPITFSVEGVPYSVKNENYDPDFSTTNAYTELNEWMTVTPGEGKVEPGELIEINYVINVPENAHGGQQNAAIVVQAMNLDNAEGTSVQALNRIAFIIYSNVKGEVNEAAKVVENNIPSFLFAPPIRATAVVENTGNVYGEATYKLQIYSVFGNEEVYSNESDEVTSMVFAETKRYNEIAWDGAPQLGVFRVKQTVEIFDEVSVTEKLVFLCPVWFLFIVLLAIFAAIFWVAGRVRNRNNKE